MSDKELLELAAKAAGIEVLGISFEMDGSFAGFPIGGQKVWNPLTDDGDALMLAAKLNLVVNTGMASIVQGKTFTELDSAHFDDDPYAATRRAIVRAAAEIGRTM